MEVVEAHFDDARQRSVEFYEDDDGRYRFEEWKAGGSEVDRGWITEGRFGERTFSTLEDAWREAAASIDWFVVPNG